MAWPDIGWNNNGNLNENSGECLKDEHNILRQTYHGGKSATSLKAVLQWAAGGVPVMVVVTECDSLS